jgi:hypothetical protein
MQDASAAPAVLPERIANRFKALALEVETVTSAANRELTTRIPDLISFRFENSALDQDILSDYVRAQSVSFVARFEHLPADVQTRLIADDRDQWRIGNLWDLRQALNDFRPIIQNQSDSVYYQNVHNTWARLLRATDKSKGTVVRVFDSNRHDVTDIYSKWLGERNRAIRLIISGLDYGYLYNGFLQHSDPELSERLFNDYVSGELNYLLWKHVLPLGALVSLLQPYHQLMRCLTFPSLGPL